MRVGVTLDELPVRSQESTDFWKAQFDAHPELLNLPRGIGGVTRLQEFVRHIWGVGLRWRKQLAGLPVTPREDFPAGPLDAMFDLHGWADAIFHDLLAAPDERWDQTHILDLDWLLPEARAMSRRRVAVHALFPAPLGTAGPAGSQH
jgi:hypothetical protein